MRDEKERDGGGGGKERDKGGGGKKRLKMPFLTWQYFTILPHTLYTIPCNT